MKKEIGYLLVGFSLIAGTLVAPEAGNAFQVENDTHLRISVGDNKWNTNLDPRGSAGEFTPPTTISAKGFMQLTLTEDKSVKIIISNGQLVAVPR